MCRPRGLLQCTTSCCGTYRVAVSHRTARHNDAHNSQETARFQTRCWCKRCCRSRHHAPNTFFCFMHQQAVQLPPSEAPPEHCTACCHTRLAFKHPSSTTTLPSNTPHRRLQLCGPPQLPNTLPVLTTTSTKVTELSSPMIRTTLVGHPARCPSPRHHHRPRPPSRPHLAARCIGVGRCTEVAGSQQPQRLHQQRHVLRVDVLHALQALEHILGLQQDVAATIQVTAAPAAAAAAAGTPPISKLSQVS